MFGLLSRFFAAQLGPIIEPPPDLALKTALGRILEGLSVERL
jgi:hypothetical protein